MLSPCDPLEPVLARSGDTAPFQTKPDASLTVPDCSTEAAFGSSSYQRSSAPAPPNTECAVQIATPPPCPGASAATAAPKRPPSGSGRYVLPLCPALDGSEEDGTARFVGPEICGTGSPFAPVPCVVTV